MKDIMKSVPGIDEAMAFGELMKMVRAAGYLDIDIYLHYCSPFPNTSAHQQTYDMICITVPAWWMRPSRQCY